MPSCFSSALRSEKVRKLFGEEDLELLEDLEHAGRCADAVRHLTCAILDRCRLKLSVVLQKSSDIPMDPSVVPSAPVARPSVPGADAPSVSSARKRNRRKKKKTVDDGDEGTGTLVDTPMAAVAEICDEWADSVSSRASAFITTLAVANSDSMGSARAASTRVLRPRRSGSRSPRGVSPTAAVDAAAPAGVGTQGTQAYSIGVTVVIGKLKARPELGGTRASIVDYDPCGGRYGVRLFDSNETMRILASNLRPSLFG